MQESVSIQGAGLHSGRPVSVTLEPAPASSGIVFVRADLPGRPQVHARPETVVHSFLYTGLEERGVRVSTVEHLLAALFGAGVDNVQVVVDSEELPILDGSALPYLQLLAGARMCAANAMRRRLRLTRPVKVAEGDRLFCLMPSRRLSIECVLEFDHPLVSSQRLHYRFSGESFRSEIAPARTFGFLRDVQQLHRQGLARGGSLQNAVVIDNFSILNPEGLRFPDEFVRHKILDILGDLALLGGGLAARVVARKSGHRLHHALVRKLALERGALVQVSLSPAGQEREEPFSLSPLRLPGFQGA